MEEWPYLLMLFGSTLCFAGQFVAMKYYQRSATQGLFQTFFFSFLTGALIFLIFGVISLSQGFVWNTTSFLYATLVGVLSFSTQIVGLLAMRFGNISIYTLFTMLGSMALPFFFGVFYYHEQPSLYRIIGSVLMVMSLFLPVFDHLSKSKEGSNKKREFWFFFLCFIQFGLNGAVSIFSSLHSRLPKSISSLAFTSFSNLIIFVLSAVGMLFIAIADKKEKQNTQCSLGFFPFLMTLLWAGFNGSGNALSMEAVKHLDASLNYPVISGGVIVLTCFLGKILFKEKNGIFTYIGVGLTLIATILFLF